MKPCILLAMAASLLAMPSPSVAATWVDETCERIVTSDDGATFTYTRPEGKMSCSLGKRRGQSEAELTCEDGTRLTMWLMEVNAIFLDGVRLNLYDGPLPCGKDGEEWPD
jgi:hypothetical protein